MNGNLEKFWDERHAAALMPCEGSKSSERSVSAKSAPPLSSSWVLEHENFLANLPIMSDVLDLGAGQGKVSEIFYELGHDVTAVDISDVPLATIRGRLPYVKTLKHDMRNPLPFMNDDFDVVVANLSLHYFARAKTHEIITEIKRVLKSGGYLIGCVLPEGEYENSVKNGFKYEKLDENFYLEDGKKPIRFFSDADFEEFFIKSGTGGKFEKVSVEGGRIKGSAGGIKTMEFILRLSPENAHACVV